jgi:hypothetical protein
MKILAALLVLILASQYLHASAGSPPFTNGSPLVSGVDGKYQATARGKNLTGVFRFTYANGSQTSSPQLPTGNSVPDLLTDPYNDYVFFVEGQVYRGLVQANINVGSVAGVLDNGAAGLFNGGSLSPSSTTTASPTATPTASPTATPTASPTATPTASPTPQTTSSTQTSTVNNQLFMSGFFNGCIDQNSPFACFSGRGEVTVNVVIQNPVITSDVTSPVFNANQVVQPVSVVKFKFHGVRNATGTFTSTTATGSTTTSG